MNRKDVVRNLPDGMKMLSRKYQPDVKMASAQPCRVWEITTSPKDVNVRRKLAMGQAIRLW